MSDIRKGKPTDTGQKFSFSLMAAITSTKVISAQLT